MKPVFLFDFDGVVLDSFDDTFHRFKIVFDELAIPFSKKVLREMFLENIHAGIRKFMTEQQLDYLNKETYKTLDIKKLHLYPHITELLNELEKKGHLIIISSNFETHIRWSLEHHNVLPHLEILGHETHHKKIEKIQSVMQRFPGSSFVYVGDTVGDVHEAKEAGIPVIAVTWGYHTKEMLEKAQPTELVTSVTELKKVLLSKYS